MKKWLLWARFLSGGPDGRDVLLVAGKLGSEVWFGDPMWEYCVRRWGCRRRDSQNRRKRSDSVQIGGQSGKMLFNVQMRPQ